MFQQCYGLTQVPFGRALPPDKLFCSQPMQEALARLRYAVQQQEPALLVGEVGVGKTTLLRALAHQLDSSCQVCYLPMTNASPRTLLRELALSLDLQPNWLTADVTRQVRDALAERAQHQELLTVLLVDEAHNLPLETLEHLRVLTNFELETRSPLVVLFSAQPVFLELLKRPPYQALNQRLVQRYQLPPLTLEDTLAYIRHHLELAGAPRPLFEDDALQLLFQAAKGGPRKINRLCTEALLVGSLEHKDVIGPNLLKRVIRDLEGLL